MVRLVKLSLCSPSCLIISTVVYNTIIVHHLPYTYVKHGSTQPYLVGGGSQDVKLKPDNLEIHEFDDESVTGATTFQTAAWISCGKRRSDPMPPDVVRARNNNNACAICCYLVREEKSPCEEAATSKDASVDPNDPTRGAAWAAAINVNPSIQEEEGGSEYEDFDPVEGADEY
jgi:hypothetical protein